MCDYRPVNPVHVLCQVEVSQVLRLFRGGVIVIVTSISMCTEAMEVLNTQVEILK